MDDVLAARLAAIMDGVVAREDAKTAREAARAAAWRAAVRDAIAPALEEIAADLGRNGYRTRLSKRHIHISVWRGKALVTRFGYRSGADGPQLAYEAPAPPHVGRKIARLRGMDAGDNEERPPRRPALMKADVIESFLDRFEADAKALPVAD
jgi:hypothetical protein